MYKVKGFQTEGKIALGEFVMVVSGTNAGDCFFLNSINEANGTAKLARNRTVSYYTTVPIDYLVPAKLYLCTDNFAEGDVVYHVRSSFKQIFPFKEFTIDSIEKVNYSGYDRLNTGKGDSAVFMAVRDECLKIIGEVSQDAYIDDKDSIPEDRIQPFIRYRNSIFNINRQPFFDANPELKKEYTIMYKIKCTTCKHFH